MLCTCVNVLDMSKMIQVRNVPEPVHRELRLRAVRAGTSLSDYMLRLAEAEVATPPIEEVLARMAGRAPMRLPEPPEALVREDRDR